jgi:hypothetical protein
MKVSLIRIIMIELDFNVLCSPFDTSATTQDSLNQYTGLFKLMDNKYDIDNIGNINELIVRYFDNTDSNYGSRIATFSKQFVSFYEQPTKNNNFLNKIWNKSSECLDDNTLLTILSNIMLRSKTTKIKVKCDAFNVLFDVKKIRLLMSNEKLWKLSTGAKIQNQSIPGLILHGYHVNDNDIWKEELVCIHTLFITLFKDKDLKPFMTKWFAQTLNVNIMIKNYGTILYSNIGNITRSSDNFLLTVCVLLIKFWNNGIYSSSNDYKMHQLAKIDEQYIISKNCPIKWYLSQENIDHDFTFLTKIMFLALDCLRIYYIPMIKGYYYYEKIIDTLEKKKLIFSDLPQTFLTKTEIDIINNDITLFKNLQNRSKTIFNNTQVLHSVSKMISGIFAWHNNFSKNLITFDDVFGDVFSLFSIKPDVIRHDINLSNTLHKLTSSDQVSKNPQVRYNAGILLSHNTSINFLKNDSSQVDGITTITDTIKSLTKLVIGLTKFSADNPIGIFLNNRTIYNNIYSLSKLPTKFNVGYCIIKSIGAKNEIFLQKFVLQMASDLIWIGATIKSCIEKLQNYDNMTEANKKKSVLFFDSILAFYEDLCIQLNEYIGSCQYFKELVGNPQILSTYSMTILEAFSWLPMINKFIDKNGPYKDDLLIDPSIFSKVIFNGMLFFKNNKIYLDLATNGMVSSDIKDYAQHDELLPLVEIIVLTEDDEDNLDYPDEFLDPIMSCKINNPVMLPGMDNTFMEKDVIEKHLLMDESNPFTRDKLTIEELRKYNETNVIKGQLENFLKKLSKWETFELQRKN